MPQQPKVTPLRNRQAWRDSLSSQARQNDLLTRDDLHYELHQAILEYIETKVPLIKVRLREASRFGETEYHWEYDQNFTDHEMISKDALSTRYFIELLSTYFPGIQVEHVEEPFLWIFTHKSIKFSW